MNRIDLVRSAPVDSFVTSPFVFTACSASSREISRSVPFRELSRSASSGLPSRMALSQTALAHLPRAKQQDLQQAVALVLASVKPSRLGMLILFGGYARSDRLEAPCCQSGFDLLAVTKGGTWARKLESKKSLQQALKRDVATPVNLMADDIHFINRRIQKGVYFYTDLVRDGIVLYDSGKLLLAKLPDSTAPCLQAQKQHRKQQAQADFTHWFGKAMTFNKGFRWYFRERDYSEAAFHLHQVAERLYGAILLVFGRLQPNSHDLEKLGQYAASIESQFLSVFPQKTPKERAAFALLQQAYVSARYQPDFCITEQELIWLAERVAHLQSLTERLCQARIVSYA